MRQVVFTLTQPEQTNIVSDIKAGLVSSPLFQKHMPFSGARFKYLCTSFGKYGWYSDQQKGYRYLSIHPTTGAEFPIVPDSILSVVNRCIEITGESDYRVETALINLYDLNGSVGWHQDNTEKSRNMIISISLGCSGIFFLGSPASKIQTEEVILKSGDVFILSGKDRMTYHAMVGIKDDGPKTEIGLKPGYRLNVTVRQVDI